MYVEIRVPKKRHSDARKVQNPSLKLETPVFVAS
jgi:hypothetical protein